MIPEVKKLVVPCYSSSPVIAKSSSVLFLFGNLPVQKMKQLPGVVKILKGKMEAIFCRFGYLGADIMFMYFLCL